MAGIRLDKYLLKQVLVFRGIWQWSSWCYCNQIWLYLILVVDVKKLLSFLVKVSSDFKTFVYLSLDLRIQQSLDQMLAMGFSNTDNWLSDLLTENDGDIGNTLDAIKAKATQQLDSLRGSQWSFVWLKKRLPFLHYLSWLMHLFVRQTFFAAMFIIFSIFKFFLIIMNNSLKAIFCFYLYLDRIWKV